MEEKFSKQHIVTTQAQYSSGIERFMRPLLVPNQGAAVDRATPATTPQRHNAQNPRTSLRLNIVPKELGSL